MRLPLLLLLGLPLSAAAQMNGSSFGNAQYQISQRHAQMASDFQRQTMERSMSRMGASRGQQASSAQQAAWKAQREKERAKQQQAEEEATAKVTRLTQEQERRRQEHPAKNPQQAAAQLQADNKQLKLLTVRNYHDVFLTAQVERVKEARELSPQAEQSWHNLDAKLSDEAWWSKQDGAQAAEKARAYADTLQTLVSGLLRFDLASPPPTPAPFADSRVEELLAKEAFDQNAADQLLQEASLAEKLIAGRSLAEATLEFKNLTANTAALQSNPKKLRKEVVASLNRVNSEMGRYSTRMYSLSRLSTAQSTLQQLTARYIAKNSK